MWGTKTVLYIVQYLAAAKFIPIANIKAITHSSRICTGFGFIDYCCRCCCWRYYCRCCCCWFLLFLEDALRLVDLLHYHFPFILKSVRVFCLFNRTKSYWIVWLAHLSVCERCTFDDIVLPTRVRTRTRFRIIWGNLREKASREGTVRNE